MPSFVFSGFPDWSKMSISFGDLAGSSLKVPAATVVADDDQPPRPS